MGPRFQINKYYVLMTQNAMRELTQFHAVCHQVFYKRNLSGKRTRKVLSIGARSFGVSCEIDKKTNRQPDNCWMYFMLCTHNFSSFFFTVIFQVLETEPRIEIEQQNVRCTNNVPLIIPLCSINVQKCTTSYKNARIESMTYNSHREHNTTVHEIRTSTGQREPA